MNQMYGDIVFLFEVLRKIFCTIDGTMLTSGTTESYLQMCEVAFDEARHVMVNKSINGLQERENLAVLFKKINNGLVKACEGLVLLVFARVVRTAAVEDVAASVSAFINRQTALKRKGVDRY